MSNLRVENEPSCGGRITFENECDCCTYTIKCSNVDCKFCAEDSVTGRLVCSNIPDLMHWANDNHDFTVRCKTFRQRNRRAKAIAALADMIRRPPEMWVERLNVCFPVDEDRRS